ncbi:uncharacterized protein LOC127260274 [Andrographis paniculata]|uniref:uncharacterized protein LOC127260274 n=1 Tax=Andrographis paniculata TaxID=175694 RepID=UPI0021E8C6E9|nr:uncharacterized protein LOC127260274 [Andrographis paniculata]
MRVLFDFHKLLNIVEEGIPALPEGATAAQQTTNRENKKKDKKALYLIHQSVTYEVFEKIAGATILKQSCDTLMTTYRGDVKVTKVRLQTLRRQYELLEMGPSELVAEYVSRLLTLTNQMKTYRDGFSEQAKVEKILRTLTAKFEHIVVAIEEAHDLSTMTVDEVSGTLQAHEQRMNEKKMEKPIEQAFQGSVTLNTKQSDEATSRGNSRGRGRGRGGHHSIQYRHEKVGAAWNNFDHSNQSHQRGQNYGDRGRGRGRNKGRFDKSHVECYTCHKFGHYSNECKYKGIDEKAHYAQDYDDQDDHGHALLMVTSTNEVSNSHTWFLDTGCINHMCSKRELFVELDESVRSQVMFADIV